MRKRIALVLLLTTVCFLPFSLNAQQASPYILNGTAFPLSCNCYSMTADQMWQSGSVWNKNKIDLSQSFNYIFNVFMGCKDRDGADGIVFVLQPIGTSIGTQGQGLGFENVEPSVGIPIDTWQNVDYKDPPYDHIGIYKNGDLLNGTANTLVAPVSALADGGNIEDCKWHTFRIIWNADIKILSAEIDNIKRVEIQYDLVKNVFFGEPKVYWGFSASTGGQSNVQKFCTSLNPDFKIPANTGFCAPALLPLIDNSSSFGTVVNWWWDFGDGTLSRDQNPPAHSYPTPGYYTVKLNIEANNGCISDTLKRVITIGSIPTAGFTSLPPVLCAKSEVLFKTTSTVEYGTINQWDWDFNSGAEKIHTGDSTLSKTFPVSTQHIQLTVSTLEGCVSEPVSKTMEVTLKPATSISVGDACYGDPVSLVAASLSPDVAIRQWYWRTGDGQSDSTAKINHYYPSGGRYTAAVYALNSAGCSSDTMMADLIIYQSNAKLGNDTVVAFGQPLQLHASGGEYYEWIPGTGLNNPVAPDPVALLYDDMQYVLKATTSFGCPTFDTIQIKAYKGPDIYVPNAFTPNADGRNDYFHPVMAGIASLEHFEIFNRYGQRVYSSRTAGSGWDGTMNGKPQPVGTYVWMIQGKDYLGNRHSEKGTVVLIR